MPAFLQEHSAEDVIYEDVGRFEQYVLRGLESIGKRLAGLVSEALPPERALNLADQIESLLQMKEPDFSREEVTR
ncbi:hypothetical protein Ga0100231_008125 [Opitutaceae bacterium TAV4]|nr:hypothetical protein Ga0100231_008125 [Opitutaceae bacterium TAV4]RRJ98421.1 hypothetical protein Ga0100230_008425 [Opitutaceae bacterium TAV3]